MELYCGKCKERTDTKDGRVAVYSISRKLKSGETSTTSRNVNKGLCMQCGAKKHILAGNNIIEEVKVEEPKRDSEQRSCEESKFTKIVEEELPKRKKRVRYSKDLNKISEELLKESEDL
jgi:hypothetical protein